MSASLTAEAITSVESRSPITVLTDGYAALRRAAFSSLRTRAVIEYSGCADMMVSSAVPPM